MQRGQVESEESDVEDPHGGRRQRRELENIRATPGSDFLAVAVRVMVHG